MKEADALALQIWAFRTQAVNFALKEKREDGSFQVVLGLPDRSQQTIDGSAYVRVAVARTLSGARLGLVGADGHPRFKEPLEAAVQDFFLVPHTCLREDAVPTVYDVLDGRSVLVF